MDVATKQYADSLVSDIFIIKTTYNDPYSELANASAAEINAALNAGKAIYLSHGGNLISYKGYNVDGNDGYFIFKVVDFSHGTFPNSQDHALIIDTDTYRIKASDSTVYKGSTKEYYKVSDYSQTAVI